MVQESYTKQVMDDTKLFPAWLQDHGLTLETAQAIVSELGIKTPGALGACSGSLTMRAELFSLAKQKLPFAMYAEFRRFVESRLEPQYVQAGSPLLVAVLHSMLIAVSQELSKCAQKLISFDIVPASQDSQEEAFGDAGLRILDVCSLQQQDKNMNSELVLPVVIPQVPSCSETSTSGLFCGEIDEKLEDTQHLNTSIVESICEVSNKTKEINHCVIDDDIIQGSGQVGVVSDGDLKFETSESSSYGEPHAIEDGNIHDNISPSSQENFSTQNVKEEPCIAANEELSAATHIPTEGPSEKSKFLSCPTCSQLFLTEGALQLHVERRHRRERPYKCSACGKAFIELCTLEKHMTIHAGALTYKCSECGKAFQSFHVLQSHMRIHTGKRPYKCPICSKSFTKLGNLKSHMRIHTGERQYECAVCGKAFTQSAHVTSHMRIHTGERRYECSVCRKAFTQSGHLTSHMRIHTGERPYKCSVCGKCFSQITTVKSHMRIHTGERPFECYICGKTFRQKSNVKTHLKSHQI
uniref:C2H2-type domain-containing protein n=1 Tax=Eptatretus burgeri TaxID=7764 RepID=A0A8C4NAB8_EPTBU